LVQFLDYKQQLDRENDSIIHARLLELDYRVFLNLKYILEWKKDTAKTVEN